MADNNTCGHELCNCIVDEDNNYCSAQCETAADAGITDIQCECEHAGCRLSV